MRKPTKEELVDYLASARAEASHATTAIQYLAIGAKPAAREVARDGSDRYVMSVFGPDRADGGIIVITFHSKLNGRPFTDVRSWESYRHATRTGPLAIACERLGITIERDRLADGLDLGADCQLYTALVEENGHA